MSLINEALKKAQKQRTGESPSLSAAPSIGGERPDQIARRGKSSGVGEFILPLGLGLVGLAVLVAGAVFLFRSKGDDAPAKPIAIANPPPAPTTAPVEVAPPPAVAVPPPAVVIAPQPAPPASTASSFTVPNVAASTPTQPTSTAAEPASPARPLITLSTPPATPAPPPPSPSPATPAGPPKLEPRAINFIEGLRVTGIRVSGTDSKDSKVLMNDRVYRLGSLVDAEMGLRLVGIAAVSLTFEDERGARYTRLFN